MKCDRKVPCAACVKRGAPETCQWQWNDNQIDPFILFSKLTGDIESLQARLAEVEAIIHNLPSKTSGPPILPLVGEHQPTVLDPPAPGHQLETPTRDKNESVDGIGQSSSMATNNQLHPQPMKYSTSIPHRPFAEAVPLQDRNAVLPPPPRVSSANQDAEYDAAAENAAIYLESFANQGPRTEESQSPISPEHALDTHVASHNISWQDMELTEALTSIRTLPPKLQNVDTHLAWFPHSVDGLSYNSARIKALQEVYTYLPTAAQTEYLIHLFEEKVHWRFTIVHLPALRAEIKRLWEMFAAGRQLEVDPLWLGVLFMVLALGMNNHPTTPTPGNIFPGLTTEQISALATGYHSASLKALHIGDCMGKPRPRTVQSV